MPSRKNNKQINITKNWNNKIHKYYFYFGFLWRLSFLGYKHFNSVQTPEFNVDFVDLSI